MGVCIIQSIAVADVKLNNVMHSIESVNRSVFEWHELKYFVCFSVSSGRWRHILCFNLTQLATRSWVFLLALSSRLMLWIVFASLYRALNAVLRFLRGTWTESFSLKLNRTWLQFWTCVLLTAGVFTVYEQRFANCSFHCSSTYSCIRIHVSELELGLVPFICCEHYVLKSGQSLSLLLGDLPLLTHRLSVKSFGSCIPGTSLTLLSGRIPAVLQRERQLRFFVHVAHADPKQDHYQVIGASLRPPNHWRRPCGRPRTSWLRAIDTDVQSVNIGIQSACWKASDRTLGRCIIDTATLCHGACHWRRRTLHYSTLPAVYCGWSLVTAMCM